MLWSDPEAGCGDEDRDDMLEPIILPGQKHPKGYVPDEDDEMEAR